MARVNVQEETKLFKSKLESGFYSTDRLKNSEVKYDEEKEPRDTEAVKQFTKTTAFDYLKNLM